MIAILFDVDDTLYDQLVPFQNAYEEIFQGQYDISPYELYAANRKHSDAVFEQTRDGSLSMRDMYIYRIQKAFEDMEVRISDAQALDFQEAYGRHQKQLKMSADMEKILSLCHRSGIAMGIITNGPSEHQWRKIQTLGVTKWVPGEHIIVSGDLQAAKPDPEIFYAAQRQLGSCPEEIYFVGDSFDNDVAGAKNAGWKAIWLNKRGLPSRETGGPDYIVCTEEELFQLISRLLEEIGPGDRESGRLEKIMEDKAWKKRD